MDDVFVLDKNSKYAKNRKKSSILTILFSPIFFILIFLILEIAILIRFYDKIIDLNFHFYLSFLTIAEILYIVNSKKIKDSFKLTWMIVFIVMPGLGAVVYVILEFTNIFNVNRKRLRNTVIQSKPYYNFDFSKKIEKSINDHQIIKNVDNDIVREELVNEFSFFNYFNNNAKLPAYDNTDIHSPCERLTSYLLSVSRVFMGLLRQTKHTH